MLLSFSVPCAGPLWQHQSRTGLTHFIFILTKILPSCGLNQALLVPHVPLQP